MAQTISTFTKDGFDIRFSVFPELDHPNNHFDDDGEMSRAIDAGEYEWFVACVTASKNGVEIGEDYLGGCCYSTFEAFMAEDGYFPDMVNSAVEQAKDAIASLTA